MHFYITAPREGHRVTREVVATLSPYQTRHLKRFGDYVIDLENVPQPLRGDLTILDMT